MDPPKRTLKNNPRWKCYAKLYRFGTPFWDPFAVRISRPGGSFLRTLSAAPSLRRLQAPLGRSWLLLGSLFGPCWAPSGCFRVALGRSWGALGRSWGVLGTSRGPSFLRSPLFLILPSFLSSDLLILRTSSEHILAFFRSSNPIIILPVVFLIFRVAGSLQKRGWRTPEGITIGPLLLFVQLERPQLDPLPSIWLSNPVAICRILRVLSWSSRKAMIICCLKL